MGKRKARSLKSWVIRVRETVVREYVVLAEDEKEAASDFDHGTLGPDLEILDWNVEWVEPND